MQDHRITDRRSPPDQAHHLRASIPELLDRITDPATQQRALADARQRIFRKLRAIIVDPPDPAKRTSDCFLHDVAAIVAAGDVPEPELDGILRAIQKRHPPNPGGYLRTSFRRLCNKRSIQPPIPPRKS